MSSINTNYSANQVQAQNQTIKGNQNGQQGQTVDESYNFNKGGNGGTLGGFTFKNCKETQNDFNLKSTEPAGGGGGTTSPQDWSFLSKLGDYAADIINALPKKNVTDYSTQAGQQALTNVNNAISTWGDSLQSVEGTRTEATHANLQTTGNAALSEAGNLEDAVAASNAEIGDQAADIDAAQTATAENVVATESEFNEALKNTGIVVAETTESVNLADEGAQTAAAAVGETETAVAAQNDANAAAVADAADATQVANEQFTEGQAISKEDAQLLREAINGTAVAEQGAQAAETDKTNAEQNVRDLYSQKTEAEGVVGQKQTALSTAEGKLATAEADVTSAKAALSGVKRDDPSYAGLKAELDRAEAKVKTEEQNVKNVEKELKQAEKERDKLIKQHDDAKDNYDNKVLPAYADAVDNLESAKATEKAAQEKAGISDEQLSALKENLNKAETAKNTAIETQKSYEVEGKQAVRDAEAASDAAADNLTLAQEQATVAVDAAKTNETKAQEQVNKANEAATEMLNAQTSFKEKANAMQQKNETVSNQLIPQLQDRGARALELHDKTSPVSVANDTAKSEETKNKGEDTIKGTGSGDGEGTKGAKGSSGAGGAGGAGGVGGAGGAEGSQGAGGGGTGVGEYFGKTRTDQDSHNSEFGSKGNSSSANKLINDALANATEFMADASRSDAIIDKSTITQQEKFVNWFNAALGPGMNDKTFDANPGLKEQVEAMRDQIAGLGLEITK